MIALCFFLLLGMTHLLLERRFIENLYLVACLAKVERNLIKLVLWKFCQGGELL